MSQKPKQQKIKNIITSKQAFKREEELHQIALNEINNEEKTQSTFVTQQLKQKLGIQQLEKKSFSFKMIKISQNMDEQLKKNEKVIEDAKQKDELSNSKTLKKEQFEQIQFIKEASLKETMPSGFISKQLQDLKVQQEKSANDVKQSKQNLFLKMIQNQEKITTENQLIDLFKKSQEQQNSQQTNEIQNNNNINNTNQISSQKIMSPIDQILQKAFSAQINDGTRKQSINANVRKDSINNAVRKESVLKEQGKEDNEEEQEEDQDNKNRKVSVFSMRKDSFLDNQSVGSFQSRISKKKKKLSKNQRLNKDELKRQQQEELKQKQKELEQEMERKQKEALKKKIVSAREQNIIKVQAHVKGYIQRRKYLRLIKKFNKMKYQNQVEQQLLNQQERNIQDYYDSRERLFVSEKYNVPFQQQSNTFNKLRKNTFFPVMFSTLAEKGNLDILFDEQNDIEDSKKRKRPATQDKISQPKKLNNNFLHTYKKPDISTFANQSSNKLNSQKSLSNLSIIDVFLNKNKEKIPQIFKQNNFGTEINDFENFEETQTLQEKEVRIYDKIGQIKGILQNNSEQEFSSVQYSDNFEKESFQEQSQQSLTKKQMQQIPKLKQMTKSKSKQSLRDSIISEEEYFQESFIAESIHQSQTKESIQEELSQSKLQHNKSESIKESVKMSDSKISESIRIEDDIQEIQRQNCFQLQNIQKSLISEENKGEKFDSPQKRLKSSQSGIEEDVYQQSGSLSQYDDEKFESISEDHVSKEERLNLSQQQILSTSQKKSEDFDKSQTILKKLGSPSYKKKVRFGEEENFQEASNKLLDQKTENLQKNQIQQIQVEKEKISIQQQQIFQNQTIINQNQEKIQNQKDKLQIQYMYVVEQIDNQQQYSTLKTVPTIQQLINKYQPLKTILEKEDRSLEFTREQMHIKKIEAEILQLIDKTQSISQKWENENFQKNIHDNQLNQKADYLYSKFQVEFGKLLQNNTFSKKLSLLGDFVMFKEHLGKNKQQSNQTNNQKQNNLQDVIKNVEFKQDLLQQVLTQVLENLTTMRQSQNEINQIKLMREKFDLQIQVLLKNQETIIKKQLQEQLDKRDNELKSMLQQIIENQNTQFKYAAQVQYVPTDTKKSKLQQLLELNKDDIPFRKQKVIDFDQDDEEEEKYSNLQNRKNIIRQQKQDRDFEEQEEDIYQIEEFEKLSQQQFDLIKKKLQADESISFDLEADEKSNISWQDMNLIENLRHSDLQKLNTKSTEQIVKYLSNLLLEEIQKDLFPLRESKEVQDNKLSVGQIDGKQIANQKNQQNQEKSLILIDQESFDKEQNKEIDTPKFKKKGNNEETDSQINKSDLEETKENESSFSFGKKRQSIESQSFNINISSEINLENLPKSTEQGLINNFDIENIKKTLEYYSDIIQKNKNKNNIIINIFNELKNNFRQKDPEFSGNVLSQIKIFSEQDIKQKSDISIVHSLEQEFINQIVLQINLSCKKKQLDQKNIIQFVNQRFEHSLQSAKQKVLNSLKKLVPKDFYRDASVKPFQDFNFIYSYFNHYKPPIEDDQQNPYIDYEIEKNIQNSKNNIGYDVLDLIIQDMANEFELLQNERQNILK